jgi:hypothetical protein
VDPVPDPLLFFPGSAGNRTRASGSVAKNSDHWTTEAVRQSPVANIIEFIKSRTRRSEKGREIYSYIINFDDIS